MAAGGGAPSLGRMKSSRSLIPILLGIALAGCGGASAPASSSPAAAAKPASAAPAATLNSQRALVLGGGGPVGRAWHIGMLKGLKDAGVDLTQADLVVGTSSGAVLGTQIRARKALEGLYSASLAAVSSPISPAAAPPFDLDYAQDAVKPVTSLTSISDLTPAVRIEVGKRALGATKVISEDAQIQIAAAALGDIYDWPQPLLKLAAGDVTDGTIRFFDRTQGVPIERALAASSANPLTGRTPMTIGDRRYLDGAVGGTNIDGAAGSGAVVALLPPSMLQPDVARQQVEAMRSKGAKIIALQPDADSQAAMGSDRFDLTRVKPTAEAAVRQAASVAADVRGLWGATSAPAAASAGARAAADTVAIALRRDEAINRGDAEAAAAASAK